MSRSLGPVRITDASPEPTIQTTPAQETTKSVVTVSNPPTSDTTTNTPSTTPVQTTPTTSPTTPPTDSPTTTPKTTPDTGGTPTTPSYIPPSSSSNPPIPSSTWTYTPIPIVTTKSSGNTVIVVTSTIYSSKAIALPTSNQQSTPDPVNAGAIAGGVVGGVAFLAILAAAIFYFTRRRSRKRQHHLSYSTTGGGANMGGLEEMSHHHPDDLYAMGGAAAVGAGTNTSYSDSASHRMSANSTKARPFVAPLQGSVPNSEDGSVGYYSPSQRPQQIPQQDYYDHDFYPAPYQYMPNHPMQYPHHNQSGSTQPSSTERQAPPAGLTRPSSSAERHVPHLVQDLGNSHSIDVPHSKDE